MSSLPIIFFFFGKVKKKSFCAINDEMDTQWKWKGANSKQKADSILILSSVIFFKYFFIDYISYGENFYLLHMKIKYKLSIWLVDFK